MTYEEWLQLDDDERKHVKVINFTGLLDCTLNGCLTEDGTLGVEQRAGGSSESEPRQ